MAKTYTELEAWAIFIGALVIGVVLTSLFWAFITVPQDIKKIEKEINNATDLVNIEKPNDFINFCENVEGMQNWDNTGFKQCIVKNPSERNLALMRLLCKKFNLTLSYGSFGVKCERRI